MTFLPVPLLSTDPADWLVYSDFAEEHNRKPSGKTARAVARLLEHCLAFKNSWSERPVNPHLLRVCLCRRKPASGNVWENANVWETWEWDGEGVFGEDWPRGCIQKPYCNTFYFRWQIPWGWYKPKSALQEKLLFTPAYPGLKNFLSKRPFLAWDYFRALRGLFPKILDKALLD